MTTTESHNRLLDWLDRRNAWQFVGVLYVARWLALAPVLALSHFVFTDAQKADAAVPQELTDRNAGVLLVMVVVVSPLVETLLTCTLPYFVVSRLRDYRRNRPKHCWGFVVVSACLMALMHPMLAAVLPSLITGAMLAYCYAHFATRGVGPAILATTIFHGAINIVGWAMIVMS
jgi:hypothetical protein